MMTSNKLNGEMAIIEHAVRCLQNNLETLESTIEGAEEGAFSELLHTRIQSQVKRIDNVSESILDIDNELYNHPRYGK